MIRRILGCALALACCTSMVGATPAPNADSLAKPYAQFGFDMLRELRSEQPHTNVFISPTSIAVALAMASNGASGTTRTAILSVLHSGRMSLADFNALNRALRVEIARTTQVQLTMANVLWLQNGFAIRSPFSATARDAYGAQASNLDFRGPQAVATVNAWANAHTGGMIPKVLDSIDPSTVMMLANAIAFKGKWTLPFALDRGPSQPFTTGSGAVVRVPMMTSRQDRYGYEEGNGIKAIALPYADRSFAMYLILPKDAAALHGFMRDVTPASFSALLGSMQSRLGTIEMPTFHVAYDAQLNHALAKLGMGVAFTHAANFSNIHTLPPQIAIGDVHHASFLDVNTEGTTAAAATTVGFKILAIRAEPLPFTMVVDRPFLIAIRDERNDQILFLGAIENP